MTPGERAEVERIRQVIGDGRALTHSEAVFLLVQVDNLDEEVAIEAAAVSGRIADMEYALRAIRDNPHLDIVGTRSLARGALAKETR